MTNVVDLYLERDAIFIDAEDFSDFSKLPDYQFRNLVVTCRNAGGSKARFDFGALCYSKRKNANYKSGCCPVVESSLDLVLENIFDLYVKSKLANCATTSVHFYRTLLKTFSDYYFNNLQNLDFNDYKSCCIAYEQHTQMLLIKKAQLLSSVEKKGLSNLSNSQLIFAELICMYHHKELTKFKETYVVLTRITQTNNLEAITLENLSYFYDFNKRLFYALTDFLMNRKKYPFIFSYIQGKNPQIVHYPIDGFIQTMRKKLFKEDGFFVSKNELQEIINSINEPFGNVGVEGHQKYLIGLYNVFSENLKKSHQDRILDKARLINYAVSAFAMCFYCESSINSSLINEIKIDDFNNLQSSTKGLKIAVIKPRAGYKKIEILIAAKMFPLIEDFKRFRLWVLSLVDSKDIPNLLFSLNTKLGKVKNGFESVNNFSKCNTINYKLWILGYISDFKWINPTVIRKSTGTIFLNESKSAVIASTKLGNTPSVVKRHYIESSENEFTDQVSNFFDAVHDEIANKYRKTKKKLSVRINEDSNKTAMGGCRNPIPERHSGFTSELEKPHCSNPSSCLFCENYVVHADQEDIRKLMSLKKIMKISDKNEEVMIVEKRINEILKLLYDKYPESKNIFIDVANSVELGVFDPYWQDHLNLLLDLGVEFYD